MEATTKYSSETVKLLMENNRWNFWTKDWQKRIIIEWEGPNVIPLETFRRDIIKLLGRDFLYELALNSEPTEYKVSVQGLEKLVDGTNHTA